MKRPDLSVKRPEQPLKAHQIRSADVVDFLKDSAVKQPLYYPGKKVSHPCTY